MKENIIEKYGYNDKYKCLASQYSSELIPARIVAVYQGMYDIVTENGITKAKLKGNYVYNMTEDSVPTVGDFVLVDYHSSTSIIHHLLDRSSSLVRKAPTDNKKQSQILGANIDIAFIVTSMNKDFNIGRIERYLTAIYQGGITPVIVLSKSDLCENEHEYQAQVSDIAFGVDIVTTSSATLEGIEEINRLLTKGKTVIFMGSSGVGKSSLLNAIAGEALMYVNTIREDDDKGRHTTTHRQLFMLDSGCMIVDTPGMREFSLMDAGDSVDETFRDIHDLASQCHFGDCTHDREIKCAVKEAIENGKLPASRLAQYNKQKKVDAYYTQKDYLSAKISIQKQHGKMAKEIKKQRNTDASRW